MDGRFSDTGQSCQSEGNAGRKFVGAVFVSCQQELRGGFAEGVEKTAAFKPSGKSVSGLV